MATTAHWKNSKQFQRWTTWKSQFKTKLLNGGSQSRLSKISAQSHDVYERFFFRGQGDPTWNLEPTFDRRNRLRSRKRDEQAKRLVERFVEQAQRFEPLEYDEDDVVAPIAVAQHHGLPTRLLDWSASPYVAAFFAFSDRIKSENFKGNVAIWALDTTSDETDHIVNAQCRFFRPTDHANVRMGNQQGAFTMLNTEQRDLRTFLKANQNSDLLTQFLIPAHQTLEALDDLILMGIHRASLFPDREGAAAHVDMLSRMDELRRSFLREDGRIDADKVSKAALAA